VKVNIGPYTDSGEDREIDVHIDDYDVWSMDHTLALIILPMLKKLKENKHGSAIVEDEDVPEHLRSFNAPPKDNEYETDGLVHERWDYVLDEMIWAFEQIADEDSDSKFFTGKVDFVSEAIKWDDNGEPTLYSMKHGPNHTSVFDREGYTAHYDRISTGTTLFGKYYRGLWD
jgi:hypothetical protein